MRTQDSDVWFMCFNGNLEETLSEWLVIMPLPFISLRRITIAKIGIVVLFIAICAGFSYKNNVCKTWSDYTIKHVSDSCKYNPDVNANMISIVQRYNYKIQTHYVLTEDDYILTVFRIANSSSSFNSNRQPIFLQHGTICSSEIWLQRGEDSIGFHLANAGFDVWLGNTRGNYNSPGHKFYTTQDSKFWDHSFDELVLDIPAVVSYIGNKTGRTGDLLYVGHSIGSTQVLAYASERPDQAKKNLKAMILFAPAVYLDKQGFLVNLVRFLLNIPLPFDSVDVRSPLIAMICSFTVININLCRYIFDLNFGNENNLYDPALFPIMLASLPDRESLKPFVQYIQFADTAEFKKFDYGSKGNLKKYGTEKPPKYDLGKISVPVYTFIGTSDDLTPFSNAETFHKELTVYNEIYALQNYSHMAYFLDANAKEVLYKPFFNLLEKLGTKK
ncbi:PREDICTED: gastric triacylglycerol lipase-like isoform X1 [Nicrophorus vespilloides]|uniref:Gastric triacylglycerol lipase-like isoform X1 n=1 Tax=Nicrophorus vespilloides TaxID=110193 RepID=A0ABM1MT43_NICVS|nr:PREDICTED: gastric triacylglycerol lipase-like isoform X1 [Nicrophorus vespilloides]